MTAFGIEHKEKREKFDCQVAHRIGEAVLAVLRDMSYQIDEQR
jgi:hypothetical protein